MCQDVTAPPPNLEVDESDRDSAIADEDAQTTTTSLAESIFNYRVEHGRTYHAYNEGKYTFPNDDRERDRLDKLFFAPIKNPQRALDIGTGTGIWAIDFADQFHECSVMGTDLSPIQPAFVPPNLSFVIDDAEDEWIYNQKFDFIHIRLLNGCFSDWKKVMQSAFDNLNSGGYLEIQDYVLPPKSQDGTIDGTELERWGNLLIEAAGKSGRPMDCPQHFAKWLAEVGFVDIEESAYLWPTNTWPKAETEKEIGRWNLVNVSDGMEGFCLALFTRVLGWSREEVEVFVAKVKSDVKNRSIHAYFELPVIYARKP